MLGEHGDLNEFDGGAGDDVENHPTLGILLGYIAPAPLQLTFRAIVRGYQVHYHVCEEQHVNGGVSNQPESISLNETYLIGHESGGIKEQDCHY